MFYLQVNALSERIIGIYLHEFTNNERGISIPHVKVVVSSQPSITWYKWANQKIGIPTLYESWIIVSTTDQNKVNKQYSITHFVFFNRNLSEAMVTD